MNGIHRRIVTAVTRGILLAVPAIALAGCLDMAALESFFHGPTSAPPTQASGGSGPRVYRYAGRTTSPPGPGARVDGTRGERLAWRLLGQRYYSDATDLFIREIADDPTHARPMIGLALTIAAEGDLVGGACAMRAGLHVRPEAIETITVSPGVADRCEELICRYRERMACEGPDRETAVMLSVLHYLVGEPQSAGAALALGEQLGDRSPGMQRLALVIEEAAAPPVMFAAKAPEPEPAPWTESPVIRLEPISTPSPVNVPAPVAEERPTEVVEPAPTAPVAEIEPVDYDGLRNGIQGMSDTLDRFTSKLLKRMARAD